MRISDWSADVCSSDLGPRGDLYIFVGVRPPDLFERDGLDLLCTVPVPMCVAALGGDIEAPRSEERRVGKECVSPCRSRRSPYPYQPTSNCILSQYRSLDNTERVHILFRTTVDI